MRGSKDMVMQSGASQKLGWTYGHHNLRGIYQQSGAVHLCFNITEKGQMILMDWYNRILDYKRKYDGNNVFQLK